jgi:hypothetical protein
MVYPSQPRNVRAPTIRTFGKWTVGKTTQQKRLSPKQIGTRTLEPQMAPSPVHTGHRWLRGEICWQRTRTPSQTNPRRKLQSHTGTSASP